VSIFIENLNYGDTVSLSVQTFDMYKASTFFFSNHLFTWISFTKL